MINKIGNWVFGSFFRTIGRLLVFVLLGFIIASVVDFGDIFDNFRITDLFFEKVNAEEVGIYHIGHDVKYYSDSALTNALPSNEWFDYLSQSTTTSSQLSLSGNRFYLKNLYNGIDLTPYRGGYITIPLEIALPLVSTTTQSTIPGQDYCDRWDWASLDSYNNVTRWNCARVDQTDSATITDREYIYPKIALSVNLVYKNGYVDICRYSNDTHLITCPITGAVDSTWEIEQVYIGSSVYYMSTYTGTYYLYLHRKINFYSSAFASLIEAQNQNTNAINNQTQQQQQQHDEMMESNTTQAQEEAEGFFGDFSVPDTGGLSGIITAPLNTIRSLLNSTCTNLVLPLPFVNQNLTLPCLYDIYTEHFGAFFTIYQTIVLAIVAYRCIRSIYFDIHGFMDPNDDRIEVMDL